MDPGRENIKQFFLAPCHGMRIKTLKTEQHVCTTNLFPFLDLDAVRKNVSLGTSLPSHKVRKTKQPKKKIIFICKVSEVVVIILSMVDDCPLYSQFITVFS